MKQENEEKRARMFSSILDWGKPKHNKMDFKKCFHGKKYF
jgi:hypothetical protein